MKDVKIPTFLTPDWLVSGYCSIPFKDILVGIREQESANIFYRNVYKSIYYKVALSYMENGSVSELLSREFNNYTLKSNHETDLKKFIILIDSIRTTGYLWREFPVLVFSSRKFKNKYLVADGFHRFAILAALGGNENLKCCLIKKKHSLKIRVYRKLKRRFKQLHISFL